VSCHFYFVTLDVVIKAQSPLRRIMDLLTSGKEGSSKQICRWMDRTMNNVMVEAVTEKYLVICNKGAIKTRNRGCGIYWPITSTG
jgi:hypothetical protein